MIGKIAGWGGLGLIAIIGWQIGIRMIPAELHMMIGLILGVMIAVPVTMIVVGESQSAQSQISTVDPLPAPKYRIIDESDVYILPVQQGRLEVR